VVSQTLRFGVPLASPARSTRIGWARTWCGPSTLRRAQGVRGNHVDVDTGEEFWISGVKRDRQDRHWAGRGPVEIDEDAREEYERLVGSG
jgi:hypothetical protein